MSCVLVVHLHYYCYHSLQTVAYKINTKEGKKAKEGLTYKQRQEQIRQKGHDMKENNAKQRKNNETAQRRLNTDARQRIYKAMSQ